MMKLSQNFTFAEMTRSETAIRLSIPNIPSVEQTKNLALLCGAILEPLRSSVQSRIRINSGFRHLTVNEVVGGSSTSEHCEGLAADIEVEGMTPLEVCKKIISLKLPFKQLIYEFGPDGWTHVSVSKAIIPQRVVLTATKGPGGTKYTKGLPK